MGPVFPLLLLTQLGFVEPSFLHNRTLEQAAFDQTVVGVPAADRHGTALVGFVRGLALTQDEHRRVDRFIADLGSERFRVRDQAMRELLAGKGAAIVLLQDALRDADAERRRRAELCLPLLESRSAPARTEAALRLLAAWHPPGATAAALAYLPYAGDEAVADEALGALVELGLPDVPSIKALEESLNSPYPSRRQAANLVLGYHGDTLRRSQIRQGLDDPVPQVRLGTALGLAMGGDRQGLAALVGLVGEPGSPGRKAERLLTRLAGPTAPSSGFSAQVLSRRVRQEAWLSWLAAHDGRTQLLHAAQELSPCWQSRRLAQQFLDAIAAGQLDELKKLCAVPFFLGGPLVLQSQHEFDRVFAEAFADLKKQPRPFRVTLLYGMRGDQYVPRASETEKNFLSQQGYSGLRVVMARGLVEDREELGAILIRFRDGEPRVVGVGHLQ